MVKLSEVRANIWRNNALDKLGDLECRATFIVRHYNTGYQLQASCYRLSTELIDEKVTKDSFKSQYRDLAKSISRLEREMGVVKSMNMKEEESNEVKILEPANGNGGLFQSFTGFTQSTKTEATPEFRDFTPSSDLTSIQKTEIKIVVDTKVILSKKAYDKIMTYTKLLEDEITGLGTVQQLPNGEFLVTDMYLFNQVVSRTQCEAKDDTALVELMQRMIADGHNPGDLKCWWHSHNSMGTGPSSTDLNTTKKYANGTYLISLISNHQGEFDSKISIYSPIEIELKDVPVYIQEERITEKFVDDCKNDIKKYVVKEGYTYNYNKAEPSERVFPEPVRRVYDLGDEILPGIIAPDDMSEYGYNQDKALRGETFIENGIRYVFNYQAGIYQCFDCLNNQELSPQSLEILGAYDYNNFLGYSPEHGITKREGA